MTAQQRLLAILADRPVLAAFQGAESGAVLLVAPAVARRATHTWAWSLDQQSWTVLPSTLQAAPRPA